MSNNSGSLTIMALQKFKKNFWGVFSLCIVIACAFIAVFAYVLAPDDSENANQMHISIHSKKPGFTVTMLTLPGEPKEEVWLKTTFTGKTNTDTELPLLSYRFTTDSLLYKEYNTDAALATEKGIALQSVFGNKSVSDIEKHYIAKQTFLLGTDKYGRDLLSRMLIGTRISFSIGFVAVFISLVVGITLGSVAGYFGGKVDALIMWLINVTWSIPTLLLVIGITLALGKGFWQVFIAVGLTMWVEVARVVRGQMVSAKELQYVTAARALGYTHYRIITKHILPNIMAPVIVIAAANFAAAILVESGLSFLGIGAQPPVPSWGAMIKDHYNYIILGKAYLALTPGIAIMVLVMAFMLIGNALRDAFDVKS